MLNKVYHPSSQRHQQPSFSLPLPGISETFPQFNRSAAALLASPPLDLSLRASNIITITPPSTPSPPRKRSRLMLCDDLGSHGGNNGALWRPHSGPANLSNPAIVAGLETVTTGATNPVKTTSFTATTTTTTALSSNYVASSSLGNYETLSICGGSDVGGGGNVYRGRNFAEMPANQLGVQTALETSSLRYCPTICVDDDEDDEDGGAVMAIDEVKEECDEDDDDDETIILTEDEDEMTVVSSSQGYTTATEHTNDCEVGLMTTTPQIEPKSTAAIEGDDEDEYVDVLSNDDDDVNALSANAILRGLQNQVYEAELERTGKVLTRNKRCYDDLALHSQAIDGLAKLFERSFDNVPDKEPCLVTAQPTQQKTYIDLSGDDQLLPPSLPPPSSLSVHHTMPDCNDLSMPTHTTHSSSSVSSRMRSERKRTKLRKNLNVDEETISPVSGTIIRKLREGEHLVVRKGDIDPAFNVVEITEEAKAILASIDNKIGAYLCQLCRTVYDDAFMLAQHRCPRIVHIEYKCTECEKVFNCPANLASHRRWHKPKSELHTSSSTGGGSQQKKRQSQLHDEHAPEKGDDSGADGIFPCTQCGKTFRRQAYLKKHQISHQMLENLKTLELFKGNSSFNVSSSSALQTASVTPTAASLSTPLTTVAAAAAAAAYHAYPHAVTHSNNSGSSSTITVASADIATSNKQAYTQNQRLAAAFPFAPPTHFDQRRFYTLSEFYLSQQQQQQQQLERNSAFQYVQANHLRQLNSMSSTFLPKLGMPAATLGMPLPVK